MGAVSGRHVGHFSPWPLQCFHVATASCTPTLPPRSQGALHMCGLCTHSIAGWRETCGPRAPRRPWAALRDLPIGWAEGCGQMGKPRPEKWDYSRSQRLAASRPFVFLSVFCLLAHNGCFHGGFQAGNSLALMGAD